MADYVKVPMDRLGAVIGPHGDMKRLIEAKSTAVLNIDSESGEIEVQDAKDPIQAMRTGEVLQAIARGFNPQKAIRIFDDDLLTFEVMDLSKIANTKNAMTRLKGRIIGSDGKTRAIIESLTDTEISIYGKTVGILGHADRNRFARDAIDMLIGGATHGAVYGFLEKKRRESKQSRLGSMLE